MSEWRTIYLSDSSSGSAKDFVVPTDRNYRIESILATLVTSAAVTARNVYLAAYTSTDDVTQPLFRANAGVNFDPSLTHYIEFSGSTVRVEGDGLTDSGWTHVTIPVMEALPGTYFFVESFFAADGATGIEDDLGIRALIDIRGTKDST